ncbi:MAG: FAD-dependent oxidoreductase [Chloroflexi bacterium]|nr:FAD-dependent oxidoreductase [Chloroflexota bacterium]
MPPTDRAVDILLVGGGVASARCARTLRRNGFDGSLLLVGAEDRAPYNRPPLSKELLRHDLPDELLAAEPPSWYERRSIELRTGTTVERIDAHERLATLSGGDTIRFDRALIATGAEVLRLAVPGADESITLRTAGDAAGLRRAAVAAGTAAPVVVVGGGFIGLEVASSLAWLGLRPTVVELAPVLWGGTLGVELAAWATARLSRAGVDLRLGARTSRLGDGAAWIGDERLPAAFVVVGVGVRPRTDLAETAGIRIDDGVMVDAGQRTSHPAVWAAGDVARIDGRPRIEHWHAAREAGERAGLSMSGLPVPPPPAPWVFSEIGGASLDVVGTAEGWDEERWLDRDRTLLAYLRGDRVVGLAAIGGAIAPTEARRLVEAAVTPDEVVVTLH